MKYRVYYKTVPNFMTTRKFVDLRKYTKVATVEADDVEEVFRMMNAAEGNELCCQLGVRSMSVGDLVAEVPSNGRAMACDPVGWKEVYPY